MAQKLTLLVKLIGNDLWACQHVALSRKPAARLGEVPFANKVSYRGSGGRACQEVTKSRI